MKQNLKFKFYFECNLDTLTDKTQGKWLVRIVSIVLII